MPKHEHDFRPFRLVDVLVGRRTMKVWGHYGWVAGATFYLGYECLCGEQGYGMTGANDYELRPREDSIGVGLA